MAAKAEKVAGVPSGWLIRKILRTTLFTSALKSFKVHKKLLFSQLFLLVLIGFKSFGQNDTIGISTLKADSLKESFSLFGSDKLLEASLRFDITTFLRKNPKSPPLDAIITFHLSETDSLDRKVSIKYRGEYRYRTCSFPPIQLNFKKSIKVYPDSGKVKKLKLVTHCDPGDVYDDYVLREYLVYKLYNVLTDTSFRVRLLRINYIDTGRERKPISQYGLILEPIDMLAKRTSSTVVKATNLTQKNLVPRIMDRLAIFNYMIANWDWSIPGQHNVAIIVPKNISYSGLGIAIPFDFDLTGVVNAKYGFPAPETGLESNRDRLFTGICRSKEVYKAHLKEFLAMKESFYSVINEFPYLNQKSKKDCTTFLDGFFGQIEKERNLDNLVDEFLNNCKNL
ncbi:MAG: hypothetical protein MUO72_02935 [Bacteroidales bacterium]|nr:hypothetical protein [Bacteroidales bacterium]